MTHTATEHIVDLFSGFRMQPLANIDEYETKGKHILAEKIDKYVVQNRPVEFVMLGYPFKSTNDRDKVLGKLPDMGEQVSIENFATFNSMIQSVYAAGVHINIASDGYMFNDILGAEDRIVMNYKAATQEFIQEAKAPVQIWDLNDWFRGLEMDYKRGKLMDFFSITPEKLEQQILFNADTNILYKGMIRFMEEELANRDFPSRNQRQKEAKRLTREMMMRNEAYSNLVKKEFEEPGAIRLSMHPSVNNGAKYSFQLVPGIHNHHSPWHSAILLEEENKYVTIHRHDAEVAGYKLVQKFGRPFNYEKI